MTGFVYVTVPGSHSDVFIDAIFLSKIDDVVHAADLVILIKPEHAIHGRIPERYILEVVQQSPSFNTIHLEAQPTFVWAELFVQAMQRFGKCVHGIDYHPDWTVFNIDVGKRFVALAIFGLAPSNGLGKTFESIFPKFVEVSEIIC